MDWKDQLNLLASTLENEPEKETPAQVESPVSKPKQTLIVRFEKRNGKPATILSGFDGSDEEIRALAARIKKFCGTGGSAKDDEILIQGDVRSKIADFLRMQGYQVRGDLK